MANCSTCKHYGYDEICVNCHSNNVLYMPKKNSGWISVKDRLPDSGYGSVLIYTKDGGVAEGFYRIGSNAWFQYRWSANDIEVTHWMPLPEPPEGV